MAANPNKEIEINDLVNFAVQRGILPHGEAETHTRNMVAAYVRGAGFRDDDDTPYAGLVPYGFRPLTSLPPISVLERYFIGYRSMVEEDPDWEDDPLAPFLEDLTYSIFAAVDEAEAAHRRVENLRQAPQPSGSQRRTRTNQRVRTVGPSRH